MRFDLHLRQDLKEQILHLADQMKEWEESPRLEKRDREAILRRITAFEHTTRVHSLTVAGVDGSGDYPSLAYADSFVHVAVAQATIYQSDVDCGLRELPPKTRSVLYVAWFAEHEDQRREAWDRAFTALAGEEIDSVLQKSDYASIKAGITHKNVSFSRLRELLVRPHASDSGNIAIQLRSLGELGSALRTLKCTNNLRYLLVDGTLSLPFASTRDESLFHEHLKRFCCVEARSQGVGFFALSKSHGFPSIELLEEIARDSLGAEGRQRDEHWFIRLPVPSFDNWNFPLAEGRQIPPPGAVTYLVRFHRNVPVLRLDMDIEFWRARVHRETNEETRDNERRIFQDLDYACHDQRCFGYPYPIKAGHDRASLTAPERSALRKQIINAAVAAGLRRSLFRDASMATGHK